MTWLVVQLAVLLVVAAAIGLFVGWQLQRQRSEAQLADLDAKANRLVYEHGERADAAIAELEATNETLGSVRADYKQASRRLRNLDGALSDSASTIAGLEADVAMLQEQLESAQQRNSGSQRAQADAPVAGFAGDMTEEMAEEMADKLAEELAGATARIAKLESTLGERDSAIAALRKLIDNRDTTLHQLREQLERNDGAGIDEQLAKARKAAAMYEAEAEKAHARRQSGEAAAAQQIARLQAELDRLRPRSETLQAELGETRSQVAELRETQERLRADLATETAQKTVLEKRYTVLAARADSDDLKRIKGIGPVLEKSLKAQGITRFSQIAAFKPDDIETISASLQTFPDRIQRDRWVEQAAELTGEREQEAGPT